MTSLVVTVVFVTVFVVVNVVVCGCRNHISFKGCVSSTLPKLPTFHLPTAFVQKHAQHCVCQILKVNNFWIKVIHLSFLPMSKVAHENGTRNSSLMHSHFLFVFLFPYRLCMWYLGRVIKRKCGDFHLVGTWKKRHKKVEQNREAITTLNAP